MKNNQKRAALSFVRLAILTLIAATIANAPAVAQDSVADSGRKSHTVRFLTYNVCLLHDFITFDRNLLVPTNKRIAYIAKLMNENNYDVIGLQEAFIPDRDIITRRLKNYFVAMGTGSATSPTGSGLYIYSKGEIQRSIFERWEVQLGVDALSHKGFMGATTILPNGLALDVYTLHAQAGHGPIPRIANYKQMMAAVQRFSVGTGRPIVIQGDFNCRPNEIDCDWFFENTNLKMASAHLDHVDHLFYDDNDSGWDMTVESAKWVFDQPVSGRLVSDHYGMETIMRFERR